MGRASGSKKKRHEHQPPGSDAAATAPVAGPGFALDTVPTARATLGWAGLLVAVVAILVYANTLYCGFTWDDQWLILNNRRIQDPTYIRHLLFETEKLWRPLKRMSFMLDYYIWGPERPWGFHLTNIALHTGASFAFYAFALRLGLRRLGAAFTGLLFAVHPIHVEAVANISHRKEPMAMLFYMLAFLAYLRAREDAPGSPLGWLGRTTGLLRGKGLVWTARIELLVWACFFYLCGMLSKEVGAVMFPVMAVVYEILLAGGGARQRLRRLMYFAVPCVGVLLLFTFRSHLRGLLKRFTAEDVGWATGGKTESFLVLFLTEVKAFWEYLRLLVVPWPLYLDRDLPLVDGMANLGTMLGFLGIALLLGAIAFCARRAPLVSFGLAWYGLNLLPVWNIPPLTHWLIAERFIYVPSAGIAIVAGVAIEALYRGAWTSLAAAASRRLALVAGTIVVVVYAGMTVVQNRVWTSNETLWLHTLAYHPNSDRGLHGYGLELYNQGDYENAEKYYRKSVAVSPTYPEPRYALALLLLNTKRYAEAIEHAEIDAHLESENPEPYMVIGNAEFGLGQYDKAIAAYQAAVERDESHLSARFNLANGYTAAGDNDNALRVLDDALGVGEDLDLWLLRGQILQALRRYPEALDCYVRSTELAPGNTEAWNGMGRLYLMLGDRGAAGRAYRRSLELDPKQEELEPILGQLP